MKKVTALSGVVLLVFGLTLGITVSLTQDANADWPDCVFLCLYDLQCKPDGPTCPPSLGEMWYKALCTGGPLNCPGSHWSDEGVCCPL